MNSCMYHVNCVFSTYRVQYNYTDNKNIYKQSAIHSLNSVW